MGGLGVGAYAIRPVSGPEGPTLRLWLFYDPTPQDGEDASRSELRVLAEDDWQAYRGLIDAFESEGGDPTNHPEFEAMREKARSGVLACLFAPRGVGPTAWPESRDTHTQRRFPLIGQTLDGMRVLDVRRALACIGLDRRPVWITGAGDAAPVALWAAVFEPEIDRITLIDPPASVDESPAFLNLGRFLEMPQAVALLYPRDVMIEGNSDRSAFGWAADLAKRLGHESPWPVLAD
jgi:hypothetical protein